jgi:hypothetical protein
MGDQSDLLGIGDVRPQHLGYRSCVARRFDHHMGVPGQRAGEPRQAIPLQLDPAEPHHTPILEGRRFGETLAHRFPQHAFPSGFLAVISGWYTAEVGRQPWVVYGLLRTADAHTPTLTRSDVWTSLIGYVVVYAVIYSFLAPGGLPERRSRDPPRHHADLARRGEPDAGDRDQAEDYGEPEGRRVVADRSPVHHGPPAAPRIEALLSVPKMVPSACPGTARLESHHRPW